MTTTSDSLVQMLMNTAFDRITQLHDAAKILILTDDHIFPLHEKRFTPFPVIKIKIGEANKTQSTVDSIVEQMLELNIDKSWIIVGVGGGVVTDIAGYVASIYKRGIKLGLVPTTILSMTDAAIGGKNGVNVGLYKNMVGTTYRAQFLLYDLKFLETLPKEEFINGFAEIVKHACIKDAVMFEDLQLHSIEYYLENKAALATLIEKNIAIKNAVVVNDEFETGERFLLNFGHTFGHAIENLYELPHGHAISIGMVMAAKMSELLSGLSSAATAKIIALLQQYHLPVALEINKEKVLAALTKDKKRAGDQINFVLLNEIGKAEVKKLFFEQIAALLAKM